MNTKDATELLFEKMSAEQDKFRDWLKTQPADEILNHSYEYIVREDIVIAMEDINLSEEMAKVLLNSSSPLGDVYDLYLKQETGYMDNIRDTITTLADELYNAQEKQKKIPVYTNSIDYATENNELNKYYESYNLNMDCKQEIQQAINQNYKDNILDVDSAVKSVLEQFSAERVQFVLANTIKHKAWDTRISNDNKDWIKTIDVPDDKNNNDYLVVDVGNSGLTNLFINEFRKITSEPVKTKESLLEKLKQNNISIPKSNITKKHEPER